MGRMKELALIGQEYGINPLDPDATRKCILAGHADRLAHFFERAHQVQDDRPEPCSLCDGTGMARRHSPYDCPACGGMGIEGGAEPDPDAAYDAWRERDLWR